MEKSDHIYWQCEGHLHSGHGHRVAALLREVVACRRNVVQVALHLLADQLLAQELPRLEHPRNLVQRPEALGARRQLALLVRVAVGLARRPDAADEHLLDLAGWRFDADRVAVEHLDNGAGKVLLLAGEGLRIGLVVLPQADLLLLGLALGDAQLLGA